METREPGTNRFGFDTQVAVVLVTACLCLVVMEFVGTRATYYRWFGTDPADPDYQLKGWAWWSAWRVLGYLVIPAAVVAALPGERLRDYHLSPAGFLRHLPVYLGLFLLVLPAVWLASRQAEFLRTYPMYRLAGRSTFDLLAWEALYAAQFVSLEFFFRGFLLAGLRRAMGMGAIFVMVIPYCMIHFSKPMPEALGAIVAGLVLGFVAMRYRTIWGGVAIHVAVAITMDLLALRFSR